MRSVAAVLILLSGLLQAHAAEPAPLERGTAIIDPLTLRELDQGRFRLDAMLLPERSSDVPLVTSELFALGSMAPVLQAINAEFDRYVARHKASLPNETIGVGEEFAFRLFDRRLIDAFDTRFVLSGIVNRMDRAFVSSADCGEIRLIYRLARTGKPGAVTDVTPPRLPMTLNLVLKAKRDRMIGRDGAEITCAEIARRWLAVGAVAPDGARWIDKIATKDDPLDLIAYQNIDRIETNLQIAHAPKSAVRDFRTDYLLKVFRYDVQAHVFREAPMENQIDRARLLADAELTRAFKAWLLDPQHLAEFDRGIALIPEQFLANTAIASTPVGFDPSDLEPEFGLVRSGEAKEFVFEPGDVVAALAKAAKAGVRLQNIRSVGGFERRLNDVTCSGCHQTRGIGGFHFPGVDWMAQKPSNSTVVPGSPHFFGDQVRRRDILTALRDDRRPDFSKGFASRPQLRGSTELAGTEYSDGWGAHCYVQGNVRGNVQGDVKGEPAAGNDPSFRGWTCTGGLACQAAGQTSRLGMCFVKSR